MTRDPLERAVELASSIGLTKELVKPVLERLMVQLEQGSLPEELQLPEGKEAFPKLLCLDLNKWIELGRAHYGRPGAEAFLPALEAVREAVAAKRLVVPITSANLAEAGQPNDMGRRERLAHFMVGLSQNHSLRFHEQILEAELLRAVQLHYLAEEMPHCFRHRLVGRGLQPAVGCECEVSGPDRNVCALVNAFFKSPEFSIHGMVNAVDRGTVQAGRTLDRELASVLEGVRALDRDKSMAERRRLELAELLAEGSTAGRLQSVLARLEVDGVEFKEWLSSDENVEVFAGSVLSLEVRTSLLLERDTDPGCRAQPNDMMDLAFLSYAIPYANLVVTERRWAHFAGRASLGERYGTIVLTDLADLPEVLAREGCLQDGLHRD